MITISLCMIVKNEERVLKRCLDSVRDLVDEIIIVDTGSTDATKRIAAGYTDKIYDLTWNDDFSAARNFAFSKATKEYIYSADADEVLSEENRRRFRLLKETLLPEIEIVQMKYGNQLQNGTVYNFDEEYRPKLFRRQRSFVWEEPIHETVRLEPVVYDSDIVITHMPEQNHAGRDLANFRKQIAQAKAEGVSLYAMALGDLTWDEYWYKNSYQPSHYVRQMADLDIPIYNIPGNHDIPDYGAEALAQYLDEFGYDRFSFSYNGSAFIGLNSNAMVCDSERAAADARAQLEWFGKQLERYRKCNPVSYTHLTLPTIA